MRLDGIIPFTMKESPNQIEGSKLVISHLESSRIEIGLDPILEAGVNANSQMVLTLY
jgi:hypothetical protein